MLVNSNEIAELLDIPTSSFRSKRRYLINFPEPVKRATGFANLYRLEDVNAWRLKYNAKDLLKPRSTQKLEEASPREPLDINLAASWLRQPIRR